MLPLRYEALDRQIWEDPYPEYRRLRASGRIYRAGAGQWAVGRYEDVASLLRSANLKSEYPASYREFSHGAGPAQSFYGRILLYRDPPNHSPLRDLFRALLSGVQMAAISRWLPRLVDDHLAPICSGGEFDLVKDLTIPVSLQVLARLMGIPEGFLNELRPLCEQLGGAFGTRLSPDGREAADEAVVGLSRLVGEILAQRRNKGEDDFLSEVVRGAAALHVAAEDLIDNLSFLIFAGFETTASLMANGLASLLKHPDQMARLRSDPLLVSTAVEEMLRYDPPIQGVTRLVADPVTIGEYTIRPGRILILLIGSANRDERVFQEPECFDIARSPNPHLSYGGGIHACLGAALARAEVAAVLEGLLRRPRRVTLCREAARHPTSRMRCFSSLPVVALPGEWK